MDDMVTAGSLEWVLVGKREKERSVRREKVKYNPKKIIGPKKKETREGTKNE